MVLTPALPRLPDPGPGLDLDPGLDLGPGLDPVVRAVTAPGPAPAFAEPRPQPPGTTGEPDIITRHIRPRRRRRRRRAAPVVVLAAVLAAIVAASLLAWHDGPAATGLSIPATSRPPSRAQAHHPSAVIHMARARQHRRRQRVAQAAVDSAAAAVGGGAAAGLHVRGRTTAPRPARPTHPGGPGPGPAGTDGWTGVSDSAPTNSSACTVELWTSQVSAGDPAYIAAFAFQDSPYTCQAMVQTSSDGGQTWTSGIPVMLPAITTTPVTYTAITGAVYDGPGYLGRACAQASNSTLACTASISLGAGTGTSPDPALPASVDALNTSVGNGQVLCYASLYSTTNAKGSGTLVEGEFRAGTAYSTTSPLCEGWLETSADQGKTWHASPPVTVKAPAKAVTFDFIGPYPDITGILIRACTEAPSVSATPYCSGAW